MDVIVNQVAEKTYPPAAMRYEQQKLRDLVLLCRELQRSVGGKPFKLSTGLAARLVGVDYTTAWRWLKGLTNDGLLERVAKGKGPYPSQYRYLGAAKAEA